MPGDAQEHRSAGTISRHKADGFQSPDWWAALRRVVGRALVAAERAAREDTAFSQDLATLFSVKWWPQEEVPAAASEPESAPFPTAAAVPAADAGATAHTATGPPQPVAMSPDPRGAVPAARIPALAAREPLPALTGPREVSVLGGAAPAPRAPGPPAAPFDPSRVATRCRLKAEACRWQFERRRRIDNGDDVSQEDRATLARLNQADVYAWMVSPQKWRERTDDAFLTVAACYEALAEAAEYAGLAERLGQDQPAAMHLLAEAQSALRAAVEDYASTHRDEDQQSAFNWLRRESEVRRVFLRHMQLDYPAPPDNHPDLRRRIAELRRDADARASRERQVDQGIKKISYHVQKLARTGDRPFDADDENVLSVCAAVAALLNGGMLPSDTRLREALLPVAARFPQDVPPPMSRALEAVEEYVEASEAEGDDEGESGDIESGEADPLVADARSRVAGRRGVLIGGVPREAHRQKLQHGLGLAELDWLRVEHHEPFESAAVAIRRPGTGLVMILTRWRSHRDGPAARALCRELGIPLIELPRGYNLRQVAHEISRQMPVGLPA